MSTAHQPLQRRADWPERFAALLDGYRAVKFSWQRNCTTLAGDAVHALTGWRPLLPACNSERAAARALQALGGALRPAVDAVLPALATPALAWRGDVLLIEVPPGVQTPAQGWDRQALAVADGSRAWVLSRNGLVSVPAAWAVAAWGVGHG